MFVKCRPKVIKEEPSGIVFPSYDATTYPYYALLHGLSNVDADGIAVGDEVYSFVVTTQQSNTLQNISKVWTCKGSIGTSCTWLSKDGRNWVLVNDRVSRYGYTNLRVVSPYTTKASIIVEDGISGT